MTDCAVCAEEIVPLDGCVSQRMPDGPHPEADELPCDGLDDGYWVHISCTKDGVERWCRAGRPDSSPLDWCRSAGLNWTGLQGQAVRGRMVLD